MAIKTVGIVGSGIMGAGIAQCAALAGHEVVVRSRHPDSATAVVEELARSLTGQVERGRLGEEDRAAAMARLTATTELDRLGHCDLVIESVVEDLAAKKTVFRELDRVCPDGALLATNTSTLPVVEMAMATRRPEQVCGIHFFNPAPVMALVEIVRPLTASDETIAAARSFAVSLGKTAIEVEDRAGFVVNALLFPYLNNAVRLVEEGVATKEDVDRAMAGGCNFPMGPFALLDLVGLDTSVSILEALYAEFNDPNYAPRPLLRRMVAAKHLGRKSGRGFYDYDR